MGADYSSYAVFGLKFDADDLYEGTKKVKAFNHNYSESTLYCPKTGRKCWHDEKVLLDGLEKNEDGEIVFSNPKYEKYRVGYGTDRKEIFIGWAVASGTYSNGGNDSARLGFDGEEEYDLNTDARKFREDMEEVGLWHIGDYGLWSVLHCSY